jgi:hypothetical protein
MYRGALRENGNTVCLLQQKAEPTEGTSGITVIVKPMRTYFDSKRGKK